MSVGVLLLFVSLMVILCLLFGKMICVLEIIMFVWVCEVIRVEISVMDWSVLMIFMVVFNSFRESGVVEDEVCLGVDGFCDVLLID